MKLNKWILSLQSNAITYQTYLFDSAYYLASSLKIPKLEILTSTQDISSALPKVKLDSTSKYSCFIFNNFEVTSISNLKLEEVLNKTKVNNLISNFITFLSFLSESILLQGVSEELIINSNKFIIDKTYRNNLKKYITPVKEKSTNKFVILAKGMSNTSFCFINDSKSFITTLELNKSKIAPVNNTNLNEIVQTKIRDNTFYILSNSFYSNHISILYNNFLIPLPSEKVKENIFDRRKKLGFRGANIIVKLSKCPEYVYPVIGYIKKPEKIISVIKNSIQDIGKKIRKKIPFLLIKNNTSVLQEHLYSLLTLCPEQAKSLPVFFINKEAEDCLNPKLITPQTETKYNISFKINNIIHPNNGINKSEIELIKDLNDGQCISSQTPELITYTFPVEHDFIPDWAKQKIQNITIPVNLNIQEIRKLSSMILWKVEKLPDVNGTPLEFLILRSDRIILCYTSETPPIDKLDSILDTIFNNYVYEEEGDTYETQETNFLKAFQENKDQITRKINIDKLFEVFYKYNLNPTDIKKVEIKQINTTTDPQIKVIVTDQKDKTHEFNGYIC